MPETMTPEELERELTNPTDGPRDHEEEAHLQDVSTPPEDQAPAAPAGLLRQVSKLRLERQELRQREADLRQELAEIRKTVDDRFTPVTEFVRKTEEERRAAAEAAAAPDPETDPRGYARWVVDSTTKGAVQPLAEQLKTVQDRLEKLVEAREAEERSWQEQQAQAQSVKALTDAVHYENSQLDEKGRGARDAFLARRAEDYKKAGVSEFEATEAAARELLSLYGQAYDAHGELGHGGEYLTRAMESWGWDTTPPAANGNGKAETPPALAAPPRSEDPDIARRRRLQRRESPPASSARPPDGDGGWAAFRREALELADRNPTRFEERCRHFAKVRGVTDREIEQELLGLS